MRRQSIERLLPSAFQRAAGDHTVLAALLAVMEQMHAPDEEILADVDALFDPYRTPDGFVAFLSSWLDLDTALPPGAPEMPFPTGHGRLRNVIAEGAAVAQWRGTAAGLTWYLETATGVAGFDIAEPADRPFHVVVTVPERAAAHLDLVRRIVELEKPAYATTEIVVAGQTHGEGGNGDSLGDHDQ